MIGEEPATLRELAAFAEKHRRSAHNARRLASDLQLLLHSGRGNGKAVDGCSTLCRALQTVEEEADQLGTALKWIKP